MQFVVHNPGKRTAFLRELRGELVRPNFTTHQPSKTFNLRWHVFIKGSPLGMEAVEPVYVQVVPPGESELVSVQMRGNYDRADSLVRAHCFDWFPGKYQLTLTGLVNRQWMNLGPRIWFRHKDWQFKLDDQQSSNLSPSQVFSPAHATRVELID
jgi:hypothetical protein